MKSGFLLLFCGFAVLAQPPAQPTASDPIVVTIDGKDWKRSELETMIKSLPPQVITNYSANKKAFLETFALMAKLTNLAEQSGLDKKPPHEGRLYYNRLQYLATAMINDVDGQAPVTDEEMKKFYDTRKNEFQRAKTRVLYLAYNDNPMAGSAKPLTQAEARVKAEKLLQSARAGEDFLALIATNSDDVESRDKKGEFPPFRPTDAGVPPAIKTAIFSMKPGQFTDIIQQPNGFYIFRLDEFTTPEFEEVRMEIFDALKKERLDQWVNQVRKSVQVKFHDEKYLSEQGLK